MPTTCPYLHHRVEEELQRRLLAVVAAPHADHEIHRQQHHFEEHEEQDEVLRDERAGHARLQHLTESLDLHFEHSAGTLLLLRTPHDAEALTPALKALRDAGSTIHEVDADTAECIVAKNRHGETSTVPLGWDGAHTRFMYVEFKR